MRYSYLVALQTQANRWILLNPKKIACNKKEKNDRIRRKRRGCDKESKSESVFSYADQTRREHV